MQFENALVSVLDGVRLLNLVPVFHHDGVGISVQRFVGHDLSNICLAIFKLGIKALLLILDLNLRKDLRIELLPWVLPAFDVA